MSISSLEVKALLSSHMRSLQQEKDSSKLHSFSQTDIDLSTAGVGDSFVEEVSHFVNKENLETLLNLQNGILDQLQKSNQTITSFNDFSSGAYVTLMKDYERRTKLLKEMKRDLEVIFRKIRNIKVKIQEKYSVTME